MPRLLEKVVRKSISRPIIIYIMNLKRGRVPLLWLVCRLSVSLLGKGGRSLQIQRQTVYGDK